MDINRLMRWRTLIVGLVLLLAIGAGAAHWLIPPWAVELPNSQDNGRNFHPPANNPCAGNERLGHIEDVRDFDIPAGQLPESLFCFDAQSGLASGWGGHLPNRSHTAAVKGRMRAIDAIVMLVANTDLEVVPPTENGSVVSLRLRQPDGPQPHKPLT
jgi:hypothetical protein